MAAADDRRELTAEFNVSAPTLCGHIRAAERKLASLVFQDAASP